MSAVDFIRIAMSYGISFLGCLVPFLTEFLIIKLIYPYYSGSPTEDPVVVGSIISGICLVIWSIVLACHVCPPAKK